MNKGLLDFVMSISEENYDEFMKQVNLDVDTNNNIELAPLDYSWIDVVERYIPFLKNAALNPYQEVMDVADSKKMYENRFLISLILKLDDFINEKYHELNERINNSNERVIAVKGIGNLDLEELEIEIKLKSKKNEDLEKGSAYGMSAKERIERLLDVLKVVSETPFFTSLKDIKLVASPIHRTNVILEEQNFKKLLELWDFLENYLLIQKTFSTKKVQTRQQNSLNNKLRNICFINYQLFNSNIDGVSEDYYRDFLEKIIENLVQESSMDDKTFKKLVNKKFEEAYSRKQNKVKNIQAIFDKSIDAYQKQVKDAIRALK